MNDDIRSADANPTGITTFDHTKLAALLEYWLAVRALHDLRAAVVAAGLDMPWDEWLAVVHAMVAAPFFMDRCERCLGSRVPPYAAEVRGDQLTGSYRCAGCGHGWSCGWVTWAPVAETAEPFAVVEQMVPFDIPSDQPRGDAA